MERQLLLPIADEIKDEMLVREIVERVDDRISRALAEHLPQVLPKFFAEFAAEAASPADESSRDAAGLLRWLRDEHSRREADRHKLSRDYAGLEDQMKELMKYAEAIDHRVKCVRIDIALLAEEMRKYWRENRDDVDWWKRGHAHEEDQEEDAAD